LETEPEQPWQVVTLVGATTEENIEAAPYLHREKLAILARHGGAFMNVLIAGGGGTHDKLANIVSGYAQVAGFAVHDTAATKP